MASNATTLTATAAGANYPALSLRQIFECFLVAIQTTPVNATILTATAAAQNYPSLSDRELQEAILAALSGSGTSGGTTAGNYGGNSPAAFVTSPTPGMIATDTSNAKIWVYINGTWTFTGVTA